MKRSTVIVAVVVVVFFAILFSLFVDTPMQGIKVRGKINSLLGHQQEDIAPVMSSIGARFGGRYNRVEDLERDLRWFSPRPNVIFRSKAEYYRIGSKFGTGSVLIYLNEQGTVYAMHIMEDAVPPPDKKEKTNAD
ncbi:MAG: hypothetical protein ACOX3G_05435 [Armatimonadota bacterium]|jgi:hypothetical protein